jgi:hypothetical protein
MRTNDTEKNLVWLKLGFLLMVLAMVIGATVRGIGPETAWIQFFKKDADNAFEARTNIFAGAAGNVLDVWTMTNVNGYGHYAALTEPQIPGPIARDTEVFGWLVSSNYTVKSASDFFTSLLSSTNPTTTKTISAGANINIVDNGTNLVLEASAGAAGDSVLVDGINTTNPNFDDGGDVNFTYSAPNIQAIIKASTVTFSKFQTLTTDRLVGRDTTGSGDAEEIQVTGGLEFTGSQSIQRSALTGDVTAPAGNNATTIANGAVSLAKMANLVTDRLIGRDTAGTGTPEALTVGGGIEFTGSGGIQSSAFTGDVTKTAGGTAQTIANDAVSNAKAANMAQATIKGRQSGAGTGDPEDLTPAQALTVLESGGTDLVTATEGNANYVLQANGNSSGHNALGALRTSGPKIDWPAKTPNGTINVAGTNLVTIETNASFGLTLSGTGTNGQLITFYVWNTHATDPLTVTNLLNWDVPELGGTTNLIGVRAGTLTIFGMRFLTNKVATGVWYLEQWNGFLYSLKPGANVTFTTNADGTITVAATGAGGDNISVDGSGVTDPNFDDGGDINFAHSAGTITATVKNGTITHAKYQNIATDRLLGRDTAGSGSPEELTVGGGLEFTGSGGIQRSALTGDVTASAGANGTTIANNVVTPAKLDDGAAVSVLGRSANSSGDRADITASANGQYLRRSGDALGFGAIAAGDLPELNASTVAIKMKGYLQIQGFDLVNGATVPNTNDMTAATFMKVVFSNSADEGANYFERHIQVPDDWDSSVEPRAKLKFRLGGADTGTHRYVISMASVADSALYTGTVGTAINMDFAGDGTGANNDAETVGYTTLTGWGSGCTAGHHWVIRVARDGNATQDGSTVDSSPITLTIEYGLSQ